RWVTVLAIQFGGFAKLAERLDPEDMRALADRYAETISGEIRRFAGTLLHSTGESILAVFGAPAAHEDDADRAVRAGLAIRHCRLSLPPRSRGNQLSIGIGIHTGEVLAGPDAHHQYAVSGAPVSIAVGLASSSRSSAVTVGEQTYRATYQHVRYRSLPPVRADSDHPLAAWEALEVGSDPVSRPLGHGPFVGRENELEVLLEVLARVAREERPHMVSVLGEPGIGKSRLTTEFERRALATTNVKLLRGRCLPYGEVIGYGALAVALGELAGIAPDDPAGEGRSKPAHMVSDSLDAPASDAGVQEIERHLALLMGLDSSSDRTGARTDERSMYVSVRRFLESVARAQPICLLLEDLHWADDALLNLLEHVAERAL